MLLVIVRLLFAEDIAAKDAHALERKKEKSLGWARVETARGESVFKTQLQSPRTYANEDGRRWWWYP